MVVSKIDGRYKNTIDSISITCISWEDNPLGLINIWAKAFRIFPVSPNAMTKLMRHEQARDDNLTPHSDDVNSHTGDVANSNSKPNKDPKIYIYKYSAPTPT